MKSTLTLRPTASAADLEFHARYNEYFVKKPAIVRGLHHILSVISICLVVLATIALGVALYYTMVWATSGNHTLLDDAWVGFGMACSLMVFPWGLDSMLMGWFPAVIFPANWYRSPLNFKTGAKYIFAGFGILCAGAPGFVYYWGLLSDALAKIL